MKILALAFLLCFSLSGFAQNGPLDVNFECQAYPTGLIPGLRFEKGFSGKNAISLRLGYQIIDHRDQGKHDDETGNGLGFTLGCKRFFRENYSGWFVGLRNDLWWNKMNWTNITPTDETIKGTTEILVVQPTAEAGYLFAFGKNWVFVPTLSFGYELNVKTDGEPTGEGVIVLLGVNLGRRF